MQTVSELVPQIVALMEAENVPVRAPVSADSVTEFEKRWNVELPPDMREFYRLVDGTSKDHSITDDMFCIWPLSERMPIPDLLPEPHYADYRNVDGASQTICFSDYMIDSDVFAIRTLAPHGIITVCSGHRPVASSFTEFLSKMLVEPLSLM